MTVTPPRAPKRRARQRSPLHLSDPWQWLENVDNPKTMAYLSEENSYYQEQMKPFSELKSSLFEQLRARVAEDDSSIPEQDGEFWYYLRYEKGQQYPLYCRKKGSLEAPEEVYLDHNEIAADQDFCELGFADVNVEHKLVAFSVDNEGDERFVIRIKDLETGQLLADEIEGASSCFEWKAKDSFFYIKLDEQNRPKSVYFHRLGTDPEQDVLVYEEKDPTFFVGLDAAESDQYIFIVTQGYHSSETYAHGVDWPDLRLQLIQERKDQHEYDVTHHGQNFIIISNDQAVNYRMFTAPIDQPSREHWRELLAHHPDILIEGMIAFETFLVIIERHEAKPRLRILSMPEQESYVLEFEEAAYEINVVGGRDFEAKSFRYWYSSLRTPQILYDYDTSLRQQTQLKTRLIPDPSFSVDAYQIERLWAPARDGKQIPVTLLYRKDLCRISPQPLLLHGYGSYGDIMECDFSSYRTCLVDQGFIYAIAHIRGGMDLGRSWYLDGKLEHKWNSFHDFIDVTEYLIAEKWTAPEFLIAEGSSAGGMLMGVVANERPELYCGILASVPFVDVLNTMLDPSQPLTTLEYFEWGHPEEPASYERIKSYSPYDNVKAQTYPHMLVIAGLHDQRVMYWEAAKWVAKLRDMKTDDHLLLFKVELKAGHGGASGRYDALHEIAEELSFVVSLKQRFMDPLLKTAIAP